MLFKVLAEYTNFKVHRCMKREIVMNGKKYTNGWSVNTVQNG